jgi:hypothetical protein
MSDIRLAPRLNTSGGIDYLIKEVIHRLLIPTYVRSIDSCVMRCRKSKRDLPVFVGIEGSLVGSLKIAWSLLTNQ